MEILVKTTKLFIVIATILICAHGFLLAEPNEHEENISDIDSHSALVKQIRQNYNLSDNEILPKWALTYEERNTLRGGQKNTLAEIPERVKAEVV